MPATICAAAELSVPKDALPDSLNLLPALIGEPDASKRDNLIIQCGAGHLSVRSGPWKFIPDLAVADGWKSAKKDPNVPARTGLYDLSKDPSETTNVIGEFPAEAQSLAGLLASAKVTPVTRPQ